MLVRYLTQDDPDQAALATRLIDEELSIAEPGLISLVVLVETYWVLKRLYSDAAPFGGKRLLLKRNNVYTALN